ncbi:MAG: hydrogenase maturation nickel metallochaperone HypA [Bryobacterales bacterium]|nr:hydrogenase maturation nickel metallochaperone HypA [Bryobacterales bacterium]
MHESAVVGALVRDVRKMVADQGAAARLIRLRTTTAFPEETVRTLFAMHSAGTPLEPARLEVEVEPLERTCVCGHRMVVHKADLTGHLHFCAACNSPAHIEEAHRLECRAIEFELPEGKTVGYS